MIRGVSMHFYVAEKDRRGDPPKLAALVLQQDGWDDHGFKTQYHVYYFGPEYDGFVGNVKILQRRQVGTSGSILLPGDHPPLDDNFCSLGQSLDYYERLASFPEQVRRDILDTLRDALQSPSHAESFHSELGWTTSVTRDLDLEGYIPLATVLLERNYDALASLEVSLKFTVAGWQNSIDLNFSGPPRPRAPFRARAPSFPPVRPPPQSIQRTPPSLPERVAVVTGLNGSGKSTLLFRLARVLHASQADRRDPRLLRLGTIDPVGIGFSRIITVSYSAFDTFQVPGINAMEIRQIIKDVQAGTGRYVFAGLRDIARELEEKLATQDAFDQSDISQDQNEMSIDRQDVTYLKSAGQLADEYVRGIERIYATGRAPILLKAFKILLSDASFVDVSDRPVSEFFQGDLRKSFMSWSTGHKIVLHATTTLIASILPKSMILMDEPESHLHPPLLAAFMHAMRLVLDEYDSFALIATHSPVVAQETLKRHISVVNRVDAEPMIEPAKIETYGESIGTITNAVFNLHADATDYHATLRGLVDSGLALEQIEGMFENGLSLQARAFVMTELASRRG